MSVNKMSRLSSLRHLTMRHVAVFYLLLLCISWLSIDQAKAFIAAFGLILIPLTVGFTLRIIPDLLKGFKKTYTFSVRNAFIWWMLGVILLTASSSIVSVIYPILAIPLSLSLTVFGLVSSIVLGNRTLSTFKLHKSFLFSIFILSAGIIVAFWYLRRISSFPLLLGDDMTSHLINISSVTHGIRGINLYDDAFILLIADAAAVAGAQPLWLFWSGPLIQYAVMAVGIYLLARKIVNNYFSSLFATIVPLWFMGDGIINDLFFLLRRNVLMALVPFFILYLLSRDNVNEPESKPGFPFLLSILAPLFFYFDVSTAFYNSTISNLPNILQTLIQPGFYFTSPAFTFNMPIAGLQNLYAVLIASLIFLTLLRLANSGERKMMLSWALVSAVSFMINYRMGLELSVILYVFILLNRYSNRIFSALSILSLGVIGLAFSGFNYGNSFAILNKILFQLNSLTLSTPQKISFLTTNYTNFFIFLTLFSILFLSFAAIRKNRLISIITALTAMGLGGYFLPIPSSERFFIFVTPFSVLIIAVTLEILIQNYLRPTNSGNMSKKLLVFSFSRLGTRIDSQTRKIKFQFHFSNEKIVKVAIFLVIAIVGLSCITQPYNSSIANYISMYGPTGTTSSFTQGDMQMANWLKANSSINTLIISDPDTTQILSGLAGMPYTLNGRFYTEGLQTLTIVSGRTDLFRNVILSLDVSSLGELVNLYDRSDKITGINSTDRQIVIVVDNRTCAWLAGSIGYQYASVFNSFPGLSMMSESSFCKNSFNVSSSYLSYEVTVPNLTVKVGPELPVQYDNSQPQPVASTMNYYDQKYPNFILNLSEAHGYIVKDVPKSWILDSVQSSDETILNVTQNHDGSVLTINNATPNSNVTIHWHLFAMHATITSKLVQWQTGWKTGAYSSPSTGTLSHQNVDGMLQVSLDNGVAGGYSSVFRNDLDLQVNNKTILMLNLNATQNAQVAVAITLLSGQKIFIYNSTSSSVFFYVNAQFENLENTIDIQKAVVISGLQFFIKSSDGVSCAAFVKSFIVVQPN